MHKVEKSDVEAAIKNPDYLQPSIEGRLNAWKKVSGKFLRVTYKQELKEIIVITAVKKKKNWR